ncbi:MAG: flagellar hook-length control protein FliK [Phycisphaerales bacterium]
MTTAIAPPTSPSLSPLLRAAAPAGGFADVLTEAAGGPSAPESAQFARDPRTDRRSRGAGSAVDSRLYDASEPIEVGPLTANVLAVEELAPRIDSARADRAARGAPEPSPDASDEPVTARTESAPRSSEREARSMGRVSAQTASPPAVATGAVQHAARPDEGASVDEAAPSDPHPSPRAVITGSTSPAANSAVGASGVQARSDSAAQPAARSSSAAGPVAGVSRSAGPPGAARLPGAFRAPHGFTMLEAGLDPLAGQVARGLAAALRQNGGSVTLQLEPAALGALKVRLRLDAGRVEATFEAANDPARRLLDGALAGLRSALEAHGLAVDRLDVKLAERAEWLGQDAQGPGVGPEPHAHGSADQSGGDRPSGSEDPEAGGHARTKRWFAERSTAPQFAAEPVVTPEGVGVGAGGALIRLRLDTVA